jgi:hypothetical protein
VVLCPQPPGQKAPFAGLGVYLPLLMATVLAEHIRWEGVTK